jgi:hypothetical protein
MLQALNGDKMHDDAWHLASNPLYTTEHRDDVVLCFQCLFYWDDPPLQMVSNVINYICQALKVGKPLV